MYGPPSQADLKAMTNEALLDKLVAVASQNNEMDCRAELAAYKAEVARRLKAKK